MTALSSKLISVFSKAVKKLASRATPNIEVYNNIKAILEMRGMIAFNDVTKLAQQIERDFRDDAMPTTLELKELTEKYELKIRKVILAATGSEDSVSKLALQLRQHVWNPNHDPNEAIAQLVRYADMTNRVMEHVLLSKHHKTMKRNAKRHGDIEEARESEKKYILGVRYLVWEYGPDQVENGLETALKVTFGDTVQGRMDYRRILKRIQSTGLEDAKEKPCLAAGRYEGGLKASARDARPVMASDANIIDELQSLSDREDEVKLRLVHELAAIHEAMPGLETRFQTQSVELDAALEIYSDQRARAKKLLDEKNKIIGFLSKRGDNIDGYETADEIVTLIDTPRVRTLSLEDFILSGNEQGELAVNMKDVDTVAKNSNDEQVQLLREEISDKRLHNQSIREEKQIAKARAVKISRKTEAFVYEIEKLSSRSLNLDAAALTISRDIADLEAEMADNDKAGSPAILTRAYPPLFELETWANDNLKDRVRIRRNAFNVAAGLSASHKHPEWIYQGLDLLANEYWDQITSGDQNFDKAQSLRAAFTEKLNNLHMHVGGSITNMTAYIREQHSVRFDGEKMFLDQHLRRGVSRDPNNILCIYFTWKPETRQVLVGHLPTHFDLKRS